MTLTYIDLCCGAGGFTQGLHQAGLHHVLGVDMSAACGESYEANHGRGTFIQGSITDADLSAKIKERAKAAHGVKRIDLVAGSPPCQTLSQANGIGRATAMAQDLLCLEVVRIAHELHAPFILIENVANMALKTTKEGNGNKTVLDVLVERMASLGYEAKHCVINCVHLGVPQARKRLFVLGVKKSARTRGLLRRFAWPDSPDHPVATVRPLLLPPNDRRLREPVDTWKTPDKMHHFIKKKKGQNRETGEFIRWLDPDHPSRTVTAGYAKRRGIENLIMYTRSGRITTDVDKAHKMRMLSILEVARIQTFPDDYVFTGSVISSQYVQVGNAVPPRAAEALGRALLAAVQRA